MGHGIAQVAAQGGFEVVASRPSRRSSTKAWRASTRPREAGREGGAKGANEQEATNNAAQTRARIKGTVDEADVADCDLVVEAIVENLEIKQLFAELGRVCKPTTIFASNTCSFPIAAMAKASGRPKQFVGLHFFNPVQLMRLVEVVRTETSEERLRRRARLRRDRRQDAGLVQGHARLRGEPPAGALHVPGAPDARARRRVEGGHRHRHAARLRLPDGPITLTDYVGLDTTLSIVQGWCRRYPDEPAFQIPAILEQKVKEGKLGRKTGEGFYKWDGDKKVG